MEYIHVNGIEKPFSKLVMGTAWFHPDQEDVIDEMMDAYIQAGGNVIDCGRYYGVGACAEKLLKRWLDRSGYRDKVIIIDKACHPIITPDEEHHPQYWRVKPDLITEDLYYGLFHTGCDYFDLYELHRDDPSVPVGEIMDRLEEHRKQGLIHAYGLSNWELPRVEEAMEYCKKKGYQGVSVNNPSFSLAKVPHPRRPGTVHMDEDQVVWHEKHPEVALLSWASQAAGFFVEGLYESKETTPQWIQDVYFSETNFERMKRAKELAAQKGVESVNIALAYVLCRDFPVAAVIGSRNKKELDSCIRALDIKLTKNEIDYLCCKRDTL